MIHFMTIHYFYFSEISLSILSHFETITMENFFDVQASVPAEVWNPGQLNAHKAHLVNTMEAAKS